MGAALLDDLAPSLRPAEALAAWETAMSFAEGRVVPSPERAELAIARLFAADLIGAAADATAALDTTVVIPKVEALAASVLAWTNATSGRYGDALRAADRAGRVADRTTDREVLRFGPHLFAAVVHEAVGDVAATDRCLAAATRAITELGLTWLEPLLHAVGAVAAYHAGRWDDALAETTAGLGLLGPGGSVADNWMAAVTALVQIDRGLLDEAAATLDRWSTPTLLGAEWVLAARARLLASRREQAAEAWADAACCWAGVTGVVSPDPVRARGAARKAAERWVPLGAVGALNHLRARLRQHGVRFRTPGAVALLPGSGPSLTPNFVHSGIPGPDTPATRRRKHLVLDMPPGVSVPRAQLPRVSPRVAEDYAAKGSRTLSRDVNALLEMGLLKRVSPGSFQANRELILALLPPMADPPAA